MPRKPTGANGKENVGTTLPPRLYFRAKMEALRRRIPLNELFKVALEKELRRERTVK